VKKSPFHMMAAEPPKPLQVAAVVQNSQGNQGAPKAPYLKPFSTKMYVPTAKALSDFP
jgi:hypothetical protein